MTLGIVIPVYRAGEKLRDVIGDLHEFARASGVRCRAVLVDDCGGDEALVREICTRQSGVTGVFLQENVGQQMATYLGLAHVSDCAFVATMDDDGQHPVKLLGEMLLRLRAGADLCYAVPSRAGLPPIRRVGAAMRDALFTLSTSKPRGVRIGAYRMMTAALVKRIRPEPDGYIYLSAAAFKHKPRAECIFYPARQSQTTSYTLGKLFRLYVGLFVHGTPLRVFCRKKRGEVSRMSVLPGKGYL